jgi:hypothetical protein
MQKLSGTSSGKNNKSCGVFYHESKKTRFAFFWFFYDFLRNLQESATYTLLFENHFARRSLGRIGILPKCPWFALRPSERICPLQLGPRAPAGGGPPKFRRNGSQDRPARAEEGPEGSLGLIPAGVRSGRGAGGVARRRRPALAAVPLCAGEVAVGTRNWAARGVPLGLGTQVLGSSATGSCARGSSTRLALMAPAGGSGAAGKNWRRGGWPTAWRAEHWAADPL